MQCMIRVRRRTAGTFVVQRRESSDKYQRDIQRFSKEINCTDMVSDLALPLHELQVSSDDRTRSASEPKLDDRACTVASLFVIAIACQGRQGSRIG
jgi:hypothetical protein